MDSDRDSLEKTNPTEMERTRLVNQGSCGLIPGCTSLSYETWSWLRLHMTIDVSGTFNTNTLSDWDFELYWSTANILTSYFICLKYVGNPQSVFPMLFENYIICDL